MGNSFRQQPGPTLYGENKTPVSEDILEVGIFVAFAMIAFSFILIIPGIRGWERLWATIRVFVALWIGTVLLTTNFGYGWYEDTACVRTQYKAYIHPPNSHQEIEAKVGLFIGLRAINITLKEQSVADCLGEGSDEYESPFPDEDIDYNERFWWADPWFQGRIGFGPRASRLSQEFRAAQYRGMPYPILWIAEYFTLDGEQIRWFRKFRQAGWYTHILLWLAFATYLLAILLYIFNIRDGAIFTIFTGLIMLLAIFAFGVIIINDPEMKIPFANEEEGTVFIDPKFGWSWWLALWTGLGTLTIGIVVYVMDFFFPRKIAVVFHHSVLEEDDFFEVEEEEATGLEEYGAAGSTRRGGTTRRGRTTQRRGLTRLRQTQRKSRDTVRVNRGASQRHTQEEGIPLEEVKTASE